SDGTCSGGTTLDGGVTWQNIGVVSTTPGTAVFDSGLYYVGSQGFSLGSGSAARISTVNGDGSTGVMVYFSTSGSASIGSSSGGSSACTSVTPGRGAASGARNSCVVRPEVRDSWYLA